MTTPHGLAALAFATRPTRHVICHARYRQAWRHDCTSVACNPEMDGWDPSYPKSNAKEIL
jgi:hypothetical protein